jgi:hypothetical protein
MYKKLCFLFLPLFALILYVNFIDGNGAHFQGGRSATAYSFFHHQDHQGSLSQDSQNQKGNRNAIRIKAKHNVSAIVFNNLDGIPLKQTYYVALSLFSNYSSPTFTLYFSKASLRGPPNAC